MAAKQKFTTQIDPVLLAKTRAIAKEEGRPLQSVIEEALVDLVSKKVSKPRAQVLAKHEASVTQFAPLYERLAD